MAASVSLSTALVASSSTRIGGSFSSARAKESRWRWPPESRPPRSPTGVSSPWGSVSIKLHALAVLAGCRGGEEPTLVSPSPAATLASGSEPASNEALAAFEKGVRHLAQTQLEEALEQFHSAIQLDPGFAAAYNNRGLVFRRLNETEKAIDDYTEAIRLDPEFAAAYNNRGLAYEILEEFQRAFQDFADAIRVYPQYAEAFYNRGNRHARIGRYARSVEDYSEAIHLNPGYADAFYNRALSHTLSGADEEAQRDVESAVALGVNRAELEEAIDRIKKQR